MAVQGVSPLALDGCPGCQPTVIGRKISLVQSCSPANYVGCKTDCIKCVGSVRWWALGSILQTSLNTCVHKGWQCELRVLHCHKILPNSSQPTLRVLYTGHSLLLDSVLLWWTQLWQPSTWPQLSYAQHCFSSSAFFQLTVGKARVLRPTVHWGWAVSISCQRASMWF